MDHNEMLKQAAENLIKLAEALEATDNDSDMASTQSEADAPVAEVTFQCSDCDHSVPLTEINAKNKEAAGDAEIDDITAEDRIRCPECDGGIMVAVQAEEVPEQTETTTEQDPAPVQNTDPAQDPVPEQAPMSQNSPQAHYAPAQDDMEKHAGLVDLAKKGLAVMKQKIQALPVVKQTLQAGLDHLLAKVTPQDAEEAFEIYNNTIAHHGMTVNANMEIDAAGGSAIAKALAYVAMLGFAANALGAERISSGDHLLEVLKKHKPAITVVVDQDLKALGDMAQRAIDKGQQGLKDQKDAPVQDLTESAPTEQPKDEWVSSTAPSPVDKNAAFSMAIRLASEGFDW